MGPALESYLFVSNSCIFSAPTNSITEPCRISNFKEKGLRPTVNEDGKRLVSGTPGAVYTLGETQLLLTNEVGCLASHNE